MWACLGTYSLCPLLLVLGVHGEKTCQHSGRQEGGCTEARGYKEMEPDIVDGCLLSG